MDFPVIGKLPGFFSLLTVEISRAISSSRVTGLFTVEDCIRASREKINKRVVYIISRAEVTLIWIPLRSYFERGQFALSRAEE